MKLIHASLLRDLRPVRPLAPPGVFLAAFAITFLTVAILGIIQVHDHGWLVLSLLQKTIVFTSLALGAGDLALSLARQRCGPAGGTPYPQTSCLPPLAVHASEDSILHGDRRPAIVSSLDLSVAYPSRKEGVNGCLAGTEDQHDQRSNQEGIGRRRRKFVWIRND